MKKIALLATLLSLSLPLSSHAAQTTQNVILGPYNTTVTDYTLQPVTVTPGSTIELRLQNPSPNNLTFSAPELGLNTVVPGNAEQRIFVDSTMTSALLPSQQLTYYILDQNGNQMASSYFFNSEVASDFSQQYQEETISNVESMDDSEISDTMPSEVGQTETGQGVAQPTPGLEQSDINQQMPEQPMQQDPAIERSSTVRGFW